MPDFRAYAPDATAETKEIKLGPEESHHLVTVNRCSRGDPVIAFNGHGREWSTVCADPARSGALLNVHSSRQAAPLACVLTLAQALPKGATMDEIVRQATELGAACIVPLVSERTQVHLDGDRADKKTVKWRTAAIEAAKQCGNPWLPEITPLRRLPELLAVAKDYDLKLVASLHPGAVSLKAAVRHYRAKHPAVQVTATPRVLWVVGPEGDFSESEMTAAVLAGFTPVTLGPLVLRCDTAAVAALSLISNELAG